MPDRLFRLYQRRRIVNINVNIFVAGMLSVFLALIPVYLSRYFIDGDTTFDRILITVIAGVADVIFDVSIYYGLHWVANHWRPFGARDTDEAKKLEAHATESRFVREATLVQLERLVLSPLYYGLALGGKFFLLEHGFAREAAFVIAFAVAIVLTRIAHTIWGVKSGRMRDNPV